jgi:hypothetical protein
MPSLTAGTPLYARKLHFQPRISDEVIGAGGSLEYQITEAAAKLLRGGPTRKPAFKIDGTIIPNL